MDLILCHTTADFDAVGAAVGLTRLRPGSRIVLTGGAHPAVRDFLALHRDEYPLIERRSVPPNKIRSLVVVDTQQRDRLGKAAEWFDLPHLAEIIIYDHHLETDRDIPATHLEIEAVGATTTLIVEKLQAAIASCEIHQTPVLTPFEATVMALGIHVDTGSLTFDHSTPRDASALAWLMAQGVSLRVITEYVDPALSPILQDLLATALENLQTETVRGHTISWVLLRTDSYVPGLSSLASRLIDLTETEALLLGNAYGNADTELERLAIIGRSRIDDTNLNQLFQPLGGGGHARAASVVCRQVNAVETLEKLAVALAQQIPHPPTARELMSSPVRTIRPEISISEAHRILLRYGHSGLSIVNEQDQLVGIISRRDIDIALHHGFSHAPVKGYMTPQLKTIAPETSLPEIEELMVTYDIGRLPVLERGNLVGIVTRTDVLRQLHQQQKPATLAAPGCIPGLTCTSIQMLLQERLAPPLWQLLQTAAQMAGERGWQLFLVGGCVRDLLLANSEEPLLLTDIDLVVDGYHLGGNRPKNQLNSQTNFDLKTCDHRAKNASDADFSPAIELAQTLRKHYPKARLDVHGQFKTAALLWHKDPELNSLWIDIATARTEFYRYPAANPEVEASSIRQDLYRRDFTINALAVRLTAINPNNSQSIGELLDFFGGLTDLQERKIRVLHANSFIEDPTRIYRAVRFAVRLGFEIEPQTEAYIRYAINSGIYERKPLKPGAGESTRRVPALETRLKTELKYILQAPYWQRALKLLGDLSALRCLHPTLELNASLWWQVRLVNRCLQRLDPQRHLEHWQLRLEIIIAALEPDYRPLVATHLQLPADVITRLAQLEPAKIQLISQSCHCHQPSQWVKLFQQYDLPLLILVAAHSPRSLRRRIWQYLTVWKTVKAPLNGNDLKQLGYKPGQLFKQILDHLLAAQLDGLLQNSEQVQSFLKKNYPLNEI